MELDASGCGKRIMSTTKMDCDHVTYRMIMKVVSNGENRKCSKSDMEREVKSDPKT